MFSLTLKDIAKGLVLAVISAAVTLAYQQLSVGGAIDWNAMQIVAELSGLSYLIKNYFSSTDGKFAGSVG